MAELAILIVSYNTRALTLACLASIPAGARQTAVETIVVDNASTDGSAEALAGLSGITLIRSAENLGFARATNLAASRARAPLLLLLNPDTEARPGAIDALVDFSRRRPEAGIWGGRTVYPDGRLNPGSCWRRMTTWGLACSAAGFTGFAASPVFNPEGYGGWARDSEGQVDIVSGCFLLIPAALWHRLGGFDERFVMYGEDADLCLRARAFGARPRITPGAEIVHHGGASEPVRADKLVRLLRAKVTLVERHWRLPALGRLLLMLWPAGRRLTCRLRNKREAVAVWDAVWARREEWARGWPPA